MDVNFAPLFLISVKTVLLVVLGLYFIFSLVMLGKVRFLSGILATEASPLLVWLSVINIAVSVSLIFAGLTFL